MIHGCSAAPTVSRSRFATCATQASPSSRCRGSCEPPVPAAHASGKVARGGARPPRPWASRAPSRSFRESGNLGRSGSPSRREPVRAECSEPGGSRPPGVRVSGRRTASGSGQVRFAGGGRTGRAARSTRRRRWTGPRSSPRADPHEWVRTRRASTDRRAWPRDHCSAENTPVIESCSNAPATPPCPAPKNAPFR